jgi:hypothetical protein
MPEDFDRCVKAGGKVRTKTLSGGRYMRICFLNGKSYAGEVKQSKESQPGAAVTEVSIAPAE